MGGPGIGGGGGGRGQGGAENQGLGACAFLLTFAIIDHGKTELGKM